MVQWVRVCLPVKETWFNPRCGKIPRAMGQLSLWTATTEACLRSRACAPQREKPLQWEACTPQLESSPCSPQLEKAHPQHPRPSVKGREVKVAQSCPTLCDPVDYTVHGILQARILEWVAFPFSRRSSQPRDWTQISRIAGRFFPSWATDPARSKKK